VKEQLSARDGSRKIPSSVAGTWDLSSWNAKDSH